MVRKISFGTVAAVGLLLIASITLTMWLATTESGLRFIVARVPEKVGPVTMRIIGASGTIGGGLRVERFELEHDYVVIRAEDIRGRVSLLPLLWQTINPLEARIGHAYVQVRRPSLPHPKRAPHFLPGFLTISGDDIRIASAELVLPNKFVMRFSNVRAAGSARYKTIRFTDVAAELGDLHGEGAGLLTAGAPMQLSAQTRWKLTMKNQPPWSAAVDVDGDLSRLPATVRFTAPFRADVRGELLELTTRWHWIANAEVKEFDLRAWGAGGVLGNLSATLALKGDRDGFSAVGPVNSSGLDVGPFDGLFEGNYTAGELIAKRIQLLHRGSRSQVDARGTIRVVARGPALQLAGTWKSFRWPLDSAAPPVRSDAGEFTLKGVWPYDVTLSGAFVPAGLEQSLPVTLQGSLYNNHFEFRDASVGIFEGRALLEGRADWRPAESWQLSGNVTGLNPAALRGELPGRLNFAINAKGAGFSPQARIDIDVRDMTGQLRGTAARGRGRIARTGTAWQFTDINLVAGGLRLALDGPLSETQRNLRFTLDTDDLGIIAAGSEGRIRSRGVFAGSAKEPTLQLSASGSGLAFHGFEARTLEAEIDLDPRGGKSTSARIVARDLQAFDRRVKSLDLSLAGTSGQHVLAFDADAVNVKLRARAAGRFADGAWQGRWTELSVDDDAALHLKLESPAATRLTTASGQLETLCLKGENARICSQGSWNDERWEAAIEASDLPMTALTAGLTPGVKYEGLLDVSANAYSGAGGMLLGRLGVQLADAALRHPRANGREDLIKLGSGFLNARAEPERITAELKLDAGDTGTINGSLRAERTSADWRRLPITGELQVSTSALGFVNLYLPEIDRAAGRLRTDLAVGGSLSAPLLSGTLKLSDGELDLYQVNLRLRGVGLDARMFDNGVTFSGQGRAGEGSLAAKGTLRWSDAQPRGELQISGSNLLVTDVPEARIMASPQLKFAIDGRRIDVSGEVTIPTAKIAPADLTGAVLSSSDETVVGSKPRDPGKAWQITSNVRMLLGDNVQIDTFGLSGRLTGSLTATSDLAGVGRGTGELNVADGKYAALGRRLDITRGRLIFGGGLLADPGIDLRAQKQFPDVLAGVNVRGTLRAPRMTFFSEPSLPQSQIVSLILAGGSLESAQASDKSGATRNEALAQGGAIIAQQLGTRIGIEDVGIEQTLDNSTSLVLGKYLSPRLYISYGISLAESINTVKMRYTLGDRWTIKTEAGKEQSAEFVYTIEK